MMARAKVNFRARSRFWSKVRFQLGLLLEKTISIGLLCGLKLQKSLLLWT